MTITPQRALNKAERLAGCKKRPNADIHRLSSQQNISVFIDALNQEKGKKRTETSSIHPSNKERLQRKIFDKL